MGERGWSSLGTGIATFLGTPNSANLAAAITDETGTGFAVFNNGPSLIAAILNTPASGNLSNCTTNTLTLNNNSTAPASTGYVDNIEGNELVRMTSIGSTLKGMTFGEPPMNLSTTITLVNKTLYCVAVPLVKGQIIKGAKWYQSVAGAYTGTGYSGFGLHVQFQVIL